MPRKSPKPLLDKEGDRAIARMMRGQAPEMQAPPSASDLRPDTPGLLDAVIGEQTEAEKLQEDRRWFSAERRDFTLMDLPLEVPKCHESFPLICGLYLIYGAAGGGKTLTALGLAVWLQALGVNTSYVYAYEPGSSILASTLAAPSSHQDLLMSKRDMSGKPKVLVFDSFSLAIRMLPQVGPLAEKLGDQAYSGGLKPADLAGAALHNQLAITNKMAILATVNSEMLPIVRALSGAVTGIFSIGAPGVLSGMDRSDRLQRPVRIPFEHMDRAALSIGYGHFNASGTKKGRF